MMNNTCPIRITAAAGTNLAGTSHLPTFIIFERKSSLQQKLLIVLNRGLLDRTYQYIVQYSLLLPLKFGYFFKPVVADRSLKPAKHRRLANPLRKTTTIILYDTLILRLTAFK